MPGGEIPFRSKINRRRPDMNHGLADVVVPDIRPGSFGLPAPGFASIPSEVPYEDLLRPSQARKEPRLPLSGPLFFDRVA